MRRLYFTICSRNYLGHALTLQQSLIEAGIGDPFLVVLADRDWSERDAAALPLRVVPASSLAIPTFWDMAFRYDIVEFNTAIKPFAFRDFLRADRADAVIYLDPDCWAVSGFSELEALLSGGASAVLTPHITAPLDDGSDPGDLRILRTGVFNLGFAAFSQKPEALAFLDWWAGWMPRDCRVDLEAGIFVDQRWVDMAPAFLRDLAILHHAGYNVAYWNLLHRPVSQAPDGTWRADGDPLRFAHFSGVRSSEPERFSVHQNRFRRRSLGAFSEIYDAYLARLMRNEAEVRTALSDLDYGFAAFTDGSPVTAFHRRAHGEMVPPSRSGYEDAFAPRDAFFSAPTEALPQTPGAAISNLMYGIWRARADLRADFNLRTANGRRRFKSWFGNVGWKEVGLSREQADRGGVVRPSGLRAFFVAYVEFWSDLLKPLRHVSPAPVRRFGVRLRRSVYAWLFSPRH